jgi:predicted nucleic acid-binding protein
VTAFFDASVLVPAVVDQLTNHERCYLTFREYAGSDSRGYCSTHGLAECYSVLTALPLRRRISPRDARQLIRTTIAGHLTVISLASEDYLAAVDRVSGKGLASGIIYDALHAIAAEGVGCERIYTYNVDHFRRLCDGTITVSAP